MNFRKSLLILFIFSFIFLFQSTMQAQLSNGASAADWTLDDTNDVIHNLYTELNAGKGAILKFSATWCSPCWSYHNTHILKNIYNNLGPNGTDEARVYYIEASPSTNEGCLLGPATCSGSTAGDWTAGTPYPLIHLDGAEMSVRSNYQVSFYPTIYAVSPDKRAFLVGTASYNTLENWLTKSFKMTVSATVTDALCGQGSIQLAVNEGYGNKSYLWSNNATSKDLNNVPPGNYSVKITDDNGYFIEKSYTISGPTEILSVNYATHTDVSCFATSDGTLSVFAQGGWSNSYSYNWNNGQSGPIATNLSGGLYTVTATDINGCTDALSFGIAEPGPLLSLSTTTSASCDENNGVIDVFADGGTSPIYYEIAPGQGNYNGLFFQLAPGDYIIDLTDSNGCTTQELVTVDEIAPPVVMASAGNDLNCYQPSTLLDGTGSSTGAGISYLWTSSDGHIISGQNSLQAQADKAGEYTLIVEDGDGCQVTETIILQEDFNPPSISITGENQLTCTVTELEICVETAGANTTLWSQSGGNSTQDCIIVTSAGLYEAQVTAPNGCTAKSTWEVSTSDDQPEVNITEPEVIDCIQTTTSLTAQIMGNPNDYSVLWSSDNGNIISDPNAATITVDRHGNYTVEVVNISTGCTTSKLKEVVSEVSPAEAAFSYQIDNDGILTVQNNSLVGDDPNWQLDGQSLNSLESISQDITDDGTYEICLTVSNECGPDTHCESIQYVKVLVAEATSEHMKCHDDNKGRASINLTGGRAPFTVEWAGPNGYTASGMSIDQLRQGDYAYLVKDDFGYVKQGMISIENADALVLDELIETSLRCHEDNSGNISVMASGGTGSLSYAWNHGSSSQNLIDLAAGSYSLNIIDENNCSLMVNAEITQPDPIEVEYEGKLELDCFGNQDGFISLTSTGGTGEINYLWSDSSQESSIEQIGAGDISVVISDENQCQIIKEYSVTEPAPLSINNVSVKDDIHGNGGSVELDIIGGIGEYQYLWSNGETSRGIFGLEAGTYSCIVTDENGCLLETEEYTVSFLSSVKELTGLNHFELHPNPAESSLSLTIDFDHESDAQIILSDVNGKMVLIRSFTSNSFREKIDLSSLTQGIYFITIRAADGLATKKFIKL